MTATGATHTGRLPELNKSKDAKPTDISAAEFPGSTVQTDPSTTSLLMELPAELRNRIYSFVLGGNIIHLYPYQRKLSHSICSYPETYLEMTPCDKEVHLFDDTKYDMHSQCDHQHHRSGTSYIPQVLRPRLDLNLLLTCRQIHNEASLIPFSENTFQFDIRSLRWLPQTFTLAETKAMKSIIVTTNDFQARPGDGKDLPVQPADVQCLAAVDTLMVIIDYRRVSLPGWPGEGVEETFDAELGDERLYVLAEMEPNVVTVAIQAREQDLKEDPDGVGQVWGQRLKKFLLPPTEERTDEEKTEEER